MNTITPRPAGARLPLTHTANAADLKMQTDLVWGSLELLAGFHDWNTNEKTESEERSAEQNQCSSTYNQATNTQSLEM